MAIGASKDEAGARGVATQLAPAMLPRPAHRARRNRRLPVAVLAGAALLSLSALSGLSFSPAGPTGAATSDPATSEPSQWANQAYAAAVTMPEVRPAPTQLTGCQVMHPDRSLVYSVCGRGTGQQRIAGQCIGQGSTHPTHPAAGAWVGPGQRSQISCAYGGDHEYQASGQIELRSPGPRPE
jgi:hypothetical protein